MPIKSEKENIFKININTNEKTIDELLDEGKSFKEINEIMKPKFVEVENIPTLLEVYTDEEGNTRMKVN